MIEKNMIVQVDGEGLTLFLVTCIWGSHKHKVAELLNLDTFEKHMGEALHTLHPAGWAANEVLKGRKKELEEKIAIINRFLFKNRFLEVDLKVERNMTKKIVQVSAEQGWGLRQERIFHSVFIEVDSFPTDREQSATLAWALLLTRKDEPKIKKVLDHTIPPHGPYDYPPNLSATVIKPIDFTK